MTHSALFTNRPGKPCKVLKNVLSVGISDWQTSTLCVALWNLILLSTVFPEHSKFELLLLSPMIYFTRVSSAPFRTNLTLPYAYLSQIKNIHYYQCTLTVMASPTKAWYISLAHLSNSPNTWMKLHTFYFVRGFKVLMLVPVRFTCSFLIVILFTMRVGNAPVTIGVSE